MMNLESFDIPNFKKGSGIHIKKKNRGKFTEYCNGKVTQKCIDKAKKSGNKTLVKRATFAENARKWKHQQGGSLYSAGNVVNDLYENASQVEKLGIPWHKYDFTQTEEWADAHGYFPDERGHRDDRVKKETHPSHPSRGRWNKSGTKFYLSEKGMQDPNHTLFGLADGGQDPQAILYYKKGIVLPEITVTPKENYIHNSYDNLKLSNTTQKYQFGGKTKFHQNWLKQRIPILAQNAKISEDEAQKLVNKQIEDLKNTPEYMYDSPPYYRELSIQDQYDAENALDNGAYALYDADGKFIVYQDPYLKDFAKTHERTHAMNPVEQELAITKYKNEKRKIFANPKQKYDRYLDSSTEVYARLMDAREKYKLNPRKVYTKDDIQKIREQIKKDWGVDETNIFNRYDDDYISHLLNDIAQNDSNINSDVYYT